MRRLLIVPQRDDGIDAQGAPSGDGTSQKSNNQEQRGHGKKDKGINRVDAVKQGSNTRGGDGREEQTGENPRAGQEHSAAQDQFENIGRLSAEGDANTDFVGFLANHVGQQAINAERSEKKSDGSEA